MIQTLVVFGAAICAVALGADTTVTPTPTQVEQVKLASKD